ncbi:peptide-methionine (R)-S-oxide reductase MsrB [Fodinibius sp.]|uniref:peptide-methionine (R)-S-oxide reductase MsrB n=1 Tax=Fodinibius sp. TaxID=1872440 RepID=UPI003562752C
MVNWQEIHKKTANGNPEPPRKVEKSEAEWKEVLTDEQFRVTRKKGTEQPHSGQYCESHDPGLYACVCCGTELFDSTEKFESGSGWPSFTEPVRDNVVRYKVDKSLGMNRVEVLCNVCNAHLGHVFPDGPDPTGLRYCINSASLQLIEEG